jgi:glycosyltransferase involved in cell wall biosynthesis
VVLIPAYNEAKTIGDVIKNVPRGFMDSVKVMVVDDGSTDGTAEKAGEAGADHIERFHRNRGLGVAFKYGIEKALEVGADFIVNIDADMQFNPEDIPKLIQPLVDKEADIVICSRFMDRRLEPKMPWIKRIGNKIFSRLVSWLTGVQLTDTQCGFRAYTREAALRLNIFSTYTYTQESLIDLIEKGMRVREIPCRVKGEREGKSKLVDNVISYAIRSMAILTRTIRDYRALEFFGSIGLLVFSMGLLSGGFMFLRWLITGRTTPYQSLITASVLLLILGFLLLVLALQADMQSRERKILEEILYHNKKKDSLR